MRSAPLSFSANTSPVLGLPTQKPVFGQRGVFLNAGPQSDALHFGAKPVDKDIMRLVLEGPPRPDAAGKMLAAAFAQWPKGQEARFLMTPGAFIETDWPGDYTGHAGWETDPKDLKPLMQRAEDAANAVLTPAIRKAAKGKARYITLGVDVTTDRKMRGPHAELVGVYDVKQDKILGWTGKSYPLAVQEGTLSHVTDVGSHFFNLDGERVMILGCHDLNMFSPRAYANQSEGGDRRLRTEAMREAAEAFQPTVVLQHPHGTDTPNIWVMAWRSIEREFPGLKAWASAIGFYNFNAPEGKSRASLERTLRLTQNGPEQVGNLVLQTRDY